MAKQSQKSPATKKAVKRKQAEDFIPLRSGKQGKFPSDVKRPRRDDGIPLNGQNKAKIPNSEIAKKKSSIISTKVDSGKKQLKMNESNKKKPSQVRLLLKRVQICCCVVGLFVSILNFHNVNYGKCLSDILIIMK